MGAIISLLRSTVFGLPGSMLKKLAERLTTNLGVKVVATSKGVFDAIKGYVGNNPGKAAFIFSLFSQLGISYAVDKVTDALADQPDTAFGGAEARQALMQAIAKARQSNTGDGSAETINGMKADSNSQYLDQIRQTRVRNQLIEDAAGVVGGVDRLERIRVAMFLEDQDFAVFREMKGLPPSEYLAQ